jgi:RNA polymerase sigma factor (sigma-70 family)
MAVDRPSSGDFPEDLRVHTAWLRRLAVGLVGAGPQSEDVLQDTWATALTSPPAQREALRPWLGQVLRNFVRLRARGDRNRSRREQIVASLAPASLPSPEELLARHETLSLLAAEVRRLEEPYRSTVLLCYAEDLAPAEIARRQGIPAATVRSRLKRGLTELRRRLQTAEGDEGRAWAVALGLPSAGRLPPGAEPMSSIAKGALLMKASTKGVAAVAALLIVGAAGMLIRHRWHPGPDGSSSVTTASDDQRRRGLRLPGTGAYASGEAAIAGSVRDDQGRAIAGAAVAASGSPVAGPPALTFAGTDGSFRLPLGNGTYRVTAAALGYLPGKREAVVATSGRTLEGIDLVLTRGGHKLAGKVLDAGGGAIPGARLQFWLDSGWSPSPQQPSVLAQANADGAYAVTLPRGSHGVAVQADGYALHRAVVEITGDEARDFRLEPGAQLSGTVVTSGDRRPAAGAQVRLDSTLGGPLAFRALTTSDTEGRFSLTAVAPGSYRLTARKGPNAGGLPQPVVVAPAAVVSNLQIELSPGLALTGEVRSDGRPVTGAQVALAPRTPMNFWSAPTDRGVSDAGGRFAVEGLLPGDYRLTVIAPEHAPFQEEVSIRQSMSRTIEVQKGVKVVGRVLTAEGASAVAARVRAWTQPVNRGGVPALAEAVSDEEGRFTLERLAPGQLTLEARLGEQLGRIGPRELKGGTSPDLVVKLAGGARVSGVVVWNDGSSADGVRILASQPGMLARGEEVRAAHDGRFVAGPFAAGEIVLVARVKGDSSSWDPGRPDGAALQLAAGEHRSGLRLVVSRRAGYIRGTVVDGRGRPVTGAAVSAAFERAGRSFKRAGASTRVLTGSDGAFDIEDLPSGTYTLFVEHPEHAPATRIGVADGTSDVRVTLGRAGKLVGVVVDAAGRPLPAYAILVVPPSLRRETAAMRLEGAPGQSLPIPIAHPRGVFEIGGLAPGSYDLQVSTADGLHGVAEGLSVEAGSQRNVRIVVRPGAELTGRVLEIGSGRPLIAEVRLIVEPGKTVVTDASGRFAFQDVPPASARMLEVHTPDDSHVFERWAVAVPPETRNVDIGVVWLLPGPNRRLEPRGGATGLYLGRTPTEVTVYDLRPGSPGDQNGIRPGDRLLAIDGRDVSQFGSRAAGVMLMGPPGSPVTVSLARPGRAPWSVRLVRAVGPVAATIP